MAHPRTLDWLCSTVDALRAEPAATEDVSAPLAVCAELAAKRRPRENAELAPPVALEQVQQLGEGPDGRSAGTRDRFGVEDVEGDAPALLSEGNDTLVRMRRRRGLGGAVLQPGP
jgi:hypothetical protein